MRKTILTLLLATSIPALALASGLQPQCGGGDKGGCGSGSEKSSVVSVERLSGCCGGGGDKGGSGEEA